MESLARQRRNIFFARFYYFAICCSIGSIGAFISLFLDRKGLNGSEIGIIFALVAIVTMFGAPFIVRLISESDHPVRVLQCVILILACLTILFSFQTTFIGLAIVFCLRAFLNSNFFTTADMISLKAISGTNVGYGSIRVWGSIGWAPIVLLTGWLIEKTDVRIAAYISSGFAVFSVLVLTQLRFQGTFRSHDGAVRTAKTRTSFLEGFKVLSYDREVLLLTILIAATGIGNVGVANFETIYFDRLGASDTMIGILGMISATVEIPFMFWSDRLIRRHGSGTMLIAAVVIYALSRLAVILMPTVWVVLIARGMTGVGLTFNTLGYVSVVNERFDAGKAGSVLIILTVTLPTVISIVFNPIFGAVFDSQGGFVLYVISFIGYAFSAVWYMLAGRKKVAT